MKEVNERFKDAHPEETVKRILNILDSLSIEIEEIWCDSGINDCWSLTVHIKGAEGFYSNGKGITKELARASAYAEFIERFQCGLHLYKLQGIDGNPSLNLQSFAPDGKYMTVQELVENGEWMDYLVQTYGQGLTRKALANQCKAYECSNDDKIWTIPFYSLFEDKYIYLPAAFVKQVYCSNGCCAGNTPQEALVHALSEIMERKSTVTVLSSGKAVAPIPDAVINQFPTAAKILEAIRSDSRYDIQLFDFSSGDGFPVISSRIIDKRTHKYSVNVCADPILEIAIDRTLTELMQGKSIKDFHIRHNGNLLEEANGLPIAHNIWNQLEAGNGLFSIDFFSEEISCDKSCSAFVNLQDKNNYELLAYMLDIYIKAGKPLYIRNYSFLGFNSYMLVIPGVSESRAFSLIEPVCEYALGNIASNTLRDVESASQADLSVLLTFHRKISTNISRASNFSRLAGLPINASASWFLTYITLAFAAYRLSRYADAAKYLEILIKNPLLPNAEKSYFSCVQRYFNLKQVNASENKIRLVLEKLYESCDVFKLYTLLDNGKTPFDGYLLRCDCISCSKCKYKEYCSYIRTTEIIECVGKRYSAFVNGQAVENFKEFSKKI